MTGPLAGLRVVELSAFVAAPLAGMTLAQMGAEVIRVDRIGGGLDRARWPVTAAGESLFWAGMNKGKASLAVDLAAPEGQEIVARLATMPGAGNGILLTNLPLHGALAWPSLQARRADMILLAIAGDRRGAPQVDYTVNPAVGFPDATGPEGSDEPVAHVLPAWDCIAGMTAATALLAAERHRRLTGTGQRVDLALKDVAAAMLGHLGIVGEVAVNGVDRPRVGNALYGAYGQDFICADAERVMVVGLTARQWRAILVATGTGAAMEALATRLGDDLGAEGARFAHRAAITALLAPVFAGMTAAEAGHRLDAAGATWSRFRSFARAVAEDPDFAPGGPLYAMIDQPGIGFMPAPGSAARFAASPSPPPRPAPRLGADGAALLAALGYGASERRALVERGIVAAGS